MTNISVCLHAGPTKARLAKSLTRTGGFDVATHNIHTDKYAIELIFLFR